jgi:CO dehydrogenase/acetyl-CoA synthase alpha subunit
MDEKKLIILVQGHKCFYNLQRKDYENNLVKDKVEISGCTSFSTWRPTVDRCR